MKYKETIIRFPVMGDYVVHIEVTTDLIKSTARHEETKNIDVAEDYGALAFHIKNEGRSFIFFPYNANPGMIAHECWHVVRQIMRWTGIDIDSETVAYHLGYLVEQTTKFVRGRKR